MKRGVNCRVLNPGNLFLASSQSIIKSVLPTGVAVNSFEANSKASTALFDLLFGENILSALCIIVQISLMDTSSRLIFFVLDNCLEAYVPCPVPNNFLHSTESQTVPLGSV